MRDLPLEELMEQVKTLFSHVMFFDPDMPGAKKVGLVFDDQGVAVSGFGQFSGLGVTPREALLDLRGKLLVQADKRITSAEALREVIKSIERRRGVE